MVENWSHIEWTIKHWLEVSAQIPDRSDSFSRPSNVPTLLDWYSERFAGRGVT